MLLFRRFGFAPWLRRNFTLSTWFFSAAQCSGVFPLLSIIFSTKETTNCALNFVWDLFNTSRVTTHFKTQCQVFIKPATLSWI